MSACPACGGTGAEPVADNPAHVVNTGDRVFTSRIRNVLCTGCGLVYNDPMPSEAELAELYQAMARDVADRPSPESVRIMPIEREQAAFVAAHLPSARARVLDVGCSMGGFLAALAARGADVLGVEPSPHDAAIARERFGLDVRDGFFEHVDLGERRFDLIALRFVFEHVRDPRAILRRAASLLADDGRLFIEVPNLATPFVGLADYFSYGHLQTFTPESLSYVCGLEGLAADALEGCANAFDASPHPPSIRAILSRGASAAAVPDVASVRQHVRRYLDARAAVAARVVDLLSREVEGKRRVVIYGAGTHTAELW